MSSDENIVTARGSVEDWSGEKEEANLEEKKKYAKKIVSQHRQGSPDFEQQYGKDLSE